jgi:hypothetical protein
MNSDRPLGQNYVPNIKIGYGLRSIRSRLSKAFWVALLLLLTAFVADTWTTFSAGIEARIDDLNPLIRGMSPAVYILSAIARGAITVLVLVWFWPGNLSYRFSGRHIWALLLPFSYREIGRYFGATLVLIVIPVRALAAWNNLQILTGQKPIFKASLTIVLGFAFGVVFSNLLLYFHYRSKSKKMDITMFENMSDRDVI